MSKHRVHSGFDGSEEISLREWKNRALCAELEVRDLLKEQQRLQYLLEELTDDFAALHTSNYKGKVV